jgi:hypothetical protein
METISPMNTTVNDGIESGSSKPNSFSQEKFNEMIDTFVHEKTALPFKLNLGQALNFYMWAIIAGFQQVYRSPQLYLFCTIKPSQAMLRMII